MNRHRKNLRTQTTPSRALTHAHETVVYASCSFVLECGVKNERKTAWKEIKLDMRAVCTFVFQLELAQLRLQVFVSIVDKKSVVEFLPQRLPLFFLAVLIATVRRESRLRRLNNKIILNRNKKITNICFLSCCVDCEHTRRVEVASSERQNYLQPQHKKVTKKKFLRDGENTNAYNG